MDGWILWCLKTETHETEEIGNPVLSRLQKYFALYRVSPTLVWKERSGVPMTSHDRFRLRINPGQGH